MVHRALAEAVELFEATPCHRAEDRAVVQRYLSALAPVLAHAVLGKDVLDEIRQVERLFGHTWLLDPAPHEAAFAKWRAFRDEYERFVVRGMTVNERLHAFSLVEDYDRAVASRDVTAIKRILSTVHVDEPSIGKILARIGGDA